VSLKRKLSIRKSRGSVPIKYLGDVYGYAASIQVSTTEYVTEAVSVYKSRKSEGCVLPGSVIGQYKKRHSFANSG